MRLFLVPLFAFTALTAFTTSPSAFAYHSPECQAAYASALAKIEWAQTEVQNRWSTVPSGVEGDDTAHILNEALAWYNAYADQVWAEYAMACPAHP
ncbi:MAG: hypothetical protein AB7G93_10895 [Bdellovibrionales bacterium]